MKSVFLLVVICCVSMWASTANAGEAVSSKTFVIKNEFPEDFDAWFEKHRVGILKAANCEIMKPEGDRKYRVKTKTPIGAWHYLIRESVEANKSQATVKQSLVDGLETRISRYLVTILVRPAKDKTSITMKIDMKVDSRIVPSIILRQVQGRSIAGVQKYLDDIYK